MWRYKKDFRLSIVLNSLLCLQKTLQALDLSDIIMGQAASSHLPSCLKHVKCVMLNSCYINDHLLKKLCNEGINLRTSLVRVEVFQVLSQFIEFPVN